ncbi:MAG: glycosyltransferase family 39 protein [Solirubrobacterales bacterium]
MKLDDTRVFLSEFNQSEAEIGGIAERFPPEHRRALLLSTIGVTLVAVSVRIPLLGTTFTAPDTAQYLSTAKHVFHQGYVSNLRPPGYATVLAIFEAVGANPLEAAVIFQNAIGMILPAFVLLVGWRFFSPAVGICAGFLTAASPLTTMIEQFALSDYLFGVLIFIGTTLLAEAVLRSRMERNPWKLLAGAGVAFGLATLFRANGLIALFSMPVVLLICAPRWRAALRSSAIAVTSMVLVLAPWCIHNLVSFDDPNIASESGIALYARAVAYDEVPPSSSSANGRVALGVYNTSAYGGRAEQEVPTTAPLYKAFVEEGKSTKEASSAMATLAREAIIDNPDVYLERTAEILRRYQGIYDPQTLTNKNDRDEISTAREYARALNPHTKTLPGESGFTLAPWHVAQALTMILFILTVGGLLMLALPFLGSLRSRLAATSFLTVGLMGLVGVSLTARWEARHGIVFAPFVWLLATATVALFVKLIVAAVRRSPWRRTQDATP